MKVDRHRWDGWVTFTWILAALAILASIFLIVNLGTIKAPKTALYGTMRYEEQPNFMIWALGLGQSAGSLLLAVLFSMVNSIYKNSCDLANPAPEPEPSPPSTPLDNTETTIGNGVRLTSVPEHNPLRGILHAGDVLYTVNDKPVSRFVDAKRAILTGPNHFIYRNIKGEQLEVTVELGLNQFAKLQGESVGKY